MIGTAIVFILGMLAGAAGRNQLAEAARFAGNTAHDMLKRKNEEVKPSDPSA